MNLVADTLFADASGWITRALPETTPAPLRCPACQLQLCKGRNEPPHAALTLVNSNSLTDSDRRFTCQKCGATMVNSLDLSKPGWHHHR